MAKQLELTEKRPTAGKSDVLFLTGAQIADGYRDVGPKAP
jgi:hypothetical protein